jgi:hypothetical protein
MVADGLGHGPHAYEASQGAIRIFHEKRSLGPAGILEACHAALRSTRGAALAIAELDFLHQVVRFSGVGNIAGAILSSGKQHNLVSLNGTIGHQVRQIKEYTYPWHDQAVLLMHSDGLATRWKFENYPGLVARHPSVVAGVLYRDHYRGRDDVTVLVAKQVPAS